MARVLAVDPEPGMLVEGQRLAAERGIDNIDWVVGDSSRLGELDLPDLALVTMGASFQWSEDILDELRCNLLRGVGKAVVAAALIDDDHSPRVHEAVGWRR